VIVAIAATMALGPASAEAVVNPLVSGWISDSVTLPGTTSVAAAGHYAYVTNYYAGRLTAIDISNPALPTIAGSSEASNGLLNGSTVNIVGGYAYVASKNRNGPSGSGSNDDGTGNSLTILDIATNPASPAIVGSVRDANSLFGAYGVAVSGHYAFVAAQGCLSGQPCPNSSVGNAFAVIDISNPASPSIVAALHNNALPAPWTGSGAFGHATSVAISGNYAYVTAASQDRLTVLDISNPLNPTIVASLKDTTNLNFPVDVAVSGQYAYVTDQISPGRLTVVDVSNPANPQVSGQLDVERGISGAGARGLCVCVGVRGGDRGGGRHLQSAEPADRSHSRQRHPYAQDDRAGRGPDGTLCGGELSIPLHSEPAALSAVRVADGRAHVDRDGHSHHPRSVIDRGEHHGGLATGQPDRANLRELQLLC